MEPPAKRMRMWRAAADDGNGNNAVDRERQQIQNIQPARERQQNVASIATRTIDLSDFQRRSFHVGINARNKRGIYMMPRAPQATVTVQVVDVTVIDGPNTASKTQITVSKDDMVLTLGTLGTVTVPGLEPSTSLATSITDFSLLPILPITTTFTGTDPRTTSLSSNATGLISADEVTATITATSTLAVSMNNGTILALSRTSASSIASRVRTASSTRTKNSSDSEITSSFDTSDLDSSSTELNTVPITTDANAGAGVLATGSARPSPTPNDAGSNDSGGGVALTPQQQQVVGGVVGSVAGVALVIIALLYFLKWYRQRSRSQTRLPDQTTFTREIDGAEDNGPPAAQVMTERSHDSLNPIAVVASRLKQLRPFSTNTVASSSTANSLLPGDSERSFQRIAGRKINPVLTHGGDGYGGSYGAFEPNANVGPRDHSFETFRTHPNSHGQNPPMSHGHHDSMSEPGSPRNPFLDPPAREHTRSPTSPVAGKFAASARDSGNQPQGFASPAPFGPNAIRTDRFATLRPSPARTPVTRSPTGSSVNIAQPISTPPLMHGNVPDLPPIPSFSLPTSSRRVLPRSQDRYQQPLGKKSIGMSGNSERSMSVLSNRSSGTMGRFREDID